MGYRANADYHALTTGNVFSPSTTAIRNLERRDRHIVRAKRAGLELGVVITSTQLVRGIPKTAIQPFLL